MKRSTKKPRPKYITAGQGELLRARLGALEGWRLIVEANLSSIERYLPDSNIAKRVCDLEDRLPLQGGPPNDRPPNLEKRLDLLDGAVARQAAELAELARRLALLEAPKPKRWWWQL